MSLCPIQRATSVIGTPRDSRADANECLLSALAVFSGTRVAVGLPCRRLERLMWFRDKRQRGRGSRTAQAAGPLAASGGYRDTETKQREHANMPQAMRPESSRNTRALRCALELPQNGLIRRIKPVITRTQRTSGQVPNHFPQPRRHDYVPVFPALTVLQRKLLAPITRCLAGKPQNPRAPEILTVHAHSLFDPQTATAHQPHHDSAPLGNLPDLPMPGTQKRCARRRGPYP